MIALAPVHTTAYFNRGVIQKKIGNLKKAFSDFQKAAALGHTKAEKILKKKVFEEFQPVEVKPVRNNEKLIKEITKKGDIIALRLNESEGSYWEYKGDAWYVGNEPRTVEKICAAENFVSKITSGEIKAQLMDDFLG